MVMPRMKRSAMEGFVVEGLNEMSVRNLILNAPKVVFLENQKVTFIQTTNQNPIYIKKIVRAFLSNLSTSQVMRTLFFLS